MPTWELRTVKVALLVAVLAAAPTSAWAASFAIRTGVDAGGAVLAGGAIDPFWTISVQGGAFLPAEVAPVSDICCLMETVGVQAAWITDPSVIIGSSATGWGADPSGPGGPEAVARRSFDLTGYDLPSVSLTGAWRVADFRHGVFLNGTLIDPATAVTPLGLFCSPCDWQIDQVIAVGVGSPLLLQGVNTLEIRGSSVNSIFDGFWLDATIEGNGIAPVPEPGTLVLFGSGLVLCVRKVRRHQRVRALWAPPVA